MKTYKTRRLSQILFRGPSIQIRILESGGTFFGVLRRLNETSDRDLQFGGAHLPRSQFLTTKMSAAVDVVQTKTASHFLCQIWLPGQASFPAGDGSRPEVSGSVFTS